MAIQNIAGSVQNPQHGYYYWPSKLGNQYSASNQAAVATALPTGLTASYTGGLVLWNPVASTAKLAINFVGVAFILAQTNAALIGIGVGSGVAPTGTLTVVPSVNNLVGSSKTSQGIAYSSAAITLPTAPVLVRQIMSLDTGALTVTTNDGLPLVEVASSIVLLPGSYACITSSAVATAASFLGQFVWEEIPLNG